MSTATKVSTDTVRVRALGDRGHVAVAIIDGRIGLQVSRPGGDVSVTLTAEEAADVQEYLQSAQRVGQRQEVTA